jgi:hypothetical protein
MTDTHTEHGTTHSATALATRLAAIEARRRRAVVWAWRYRELMRDRCSDLSFEYAERVKAEARVAELEEAVMAERARCLDHLACLHTDHRLLDMDDINAVRKAIESGD